MKKTLVTLLILFVCACAAKKEIVQQAEPTKVMTTKEKVDPVKYDLSAYADYTLQINITDGLVNFNNIDGYANFNPVAFSIKNGEEKSIEMTKAGDNFFHSKAILSVLYRDGILYLDNQPNPYVLNPNTKPAREFTFNERWLSGHKYVNINTQGEAGLEQVNITVKLTPKVA